MKSFNIPLLLICDWFKLNHVFSNRQFCFQTQSKFVFCLEYWLFFGRILKLCFSFVSVLTNQLIKLIFFLITSFPHKLSALQLQISPGLNLSFCALYWLVILTAVAFLHLWSSLCSKKSPSFHRFHVRKKSIFLPSEVWCLCQPVYFAIRIFSFCQWLFFVVVVLYLVLSTNFSPTKDL